MAWKERHVIPNLDKTHIEDGYENICENCEDWGEACETCNVFIPVIVDEYLIEETTYDVMTLCGVPVGYPYEIGERKIIGVIKNK